MELYSPLISFWCRQSSLSAEDTRDVMQEVFSSEARKLVSFRRDGEAGSFRGWLRVIARNKVQDHFRRRSREAQAAGGSTVKDLLEQVPAPDSDTSEAEQGAMVGVHARALEHVRPHFENNTWQAFWQTVVEDRPAVDVAQTLRMTPEAVRQARYAVLRRLREELGDVLDWAGSSRPNELPFRTGSPSKIV